MKDTPPSPRAMDVLALCQAGTHLQGSWPLQSMPRLCSSLLGMPDEVSVVHWSVQGQTRPVAGGPPELWLELQAQARVRLQCQRCLQPLEQPLALQRRFLFVRDEAEAEHLDEEMEDDVLVLPRRLDLPELLEDELILALPLVPRHEGVCPQPLTLPLEDEAPAAAGAAAHPFAALAALRGRDSGGGGGGGGTADEGD